ncbi:MAG: 4Fe-4S dicluster domain-containing protein [Chloroflexi bacterium]|nr:4Fe-4S dicluster domain-containing protein [Chloroflexota bacterium]
MPRYGMVIDLSRCYGCRACMVACKVENNTPGAHFWMYVFRLEEGKYPDTQVRFLPRPCMHCDNAPCVKVCPVGARYKRDDGLVATDWARCIGCRYCEVACPYGVNYFNWKKPKKNQYLDWDAPAAEAVARVTNGATPPYKNPDLDQPMKDGRKTAGSGHLKGVVEKCTFCIQRVEKGLNPACVANCPAFALHFGDLDDPNSIVSRLLARNESFRLEEEFNTRPRVYYIGAPAPAAHPRQIEAVKARV